MEQKLEPTVPLGFGVWGYYPPVMGNRMEKSMDNEMETGSIQGLTGLEIRGMGFRILGFSVGARFKVLGLGLRV